MKMSEETVGMQILEMRHVCCANENCRSVILPGQKVWTVTTADEKGVISTHICCSTKCAVFMKRRSVAYYEKMASRLKALSITANKMKKPVASK